MAELMEVFLCMYKGVKISSRGIAFYANGFYVGTSLEKAKEYVDNGS